MSKIIYFYADKRFPHSPSDALIFIRHTYQKKDIFGYIITLIIMTSNCEAQSNWKSLHHHFAGIIIGTIQQHMESLVEITHQWVGILAMTPRTHHQHTSTVANACSKCCIHWMSNYWCNCRRCILTTWGFGDKIKLLTDACREQLLSDQFWDPFVKKLIVQIEVCIMGEEKELNKMKK